MTRAPAVRARHAGSRWLGRGVGGARRAGDAGAAAAIGAAAAAARTRSAARTAWSAPTTSSSTRASIRSTPSCAAPAGRRRPKPATCSTPPRCGGGSSSIPTAARSTTSSAPRSSARSAPTEAWTERAPDDAEAWFYLGGAYAARVQWRVLRGEKLAAARDGKRIKQALERAIALEPGLDDAYFGIGMYRYYADVAPAAAQDPALPPAAAGRRSDGRAARRCCGRAAAAGCCRAKPTTSCTSSISGTSGRPGGRIELLRGLQQRYPGNPLFLAQIAEIQDAYQHDVTASLDTWRALLAAGARAARQHAGARRGAGAARRRAHARSAAPDRRRHRASAGGDRAEAAGAVLVAGAGAICGSAKRTIGWARAPRRSPPTKSAIAAAPAADPLRRARPGGRADRAARRMPGTPRPSGSRSKAGAGSSSNDLPGADRRARAGDRARTRTIRSRTIASAACCRRAATTPRALAQFEHADPQRAHLSRADPRQRPPRSGAPARAARPHATRRSPAIASRRRCSAPAPRRTPRRRARSRASLIAIRSASRLRSPRRPRSAVRCPHRCPRPRRCCVSNRASTQRDRESRLRDLTSFSLT